MEQTKKPWQSKTIIVNALMAVAALLGPKYVGMLDFLQNPEMLTGIFAGVNFVLRLVTKKKISIK